MIGIKLKVIKELVDLIMLKQAVKHLLQNSDGGKLLKFQIEFMIYLMIKSCLKDLKRSVADIIVSSSHGGTD